MKQIALSLFVIAASGVYVWEQAGKASADDMLGPAPPADAMATNSSRPILPAVAAEAGPVSSPARPVPEVRRQRAQLEPPTPPAANKGTTAVIAASPTKPLLAARPPEVSQSTAPPPRPKAVANFTPTAQFSARESLSFAVTPAVYIPIPRPRPNHPQSTARVIRAGMKPATHGFTDGTFTGPVTDAYYGLIQMQASIQGGRLTALKVLKYPNDRRTSVRINRQALPMLRDEAISAQSANVDIISGATLTSRAFIQSLGGALKKASS
ncbi:FMN-binding protein [Manganibacter manganicus]|uniref:FMN-binding domain-containing protein n=1 Tax=Manganibacter manganicus TaxID=1873176 RepID=A0A1V8RNV1_9HYPH|nr:FMN-binding protein [Pseudaminobacter manganicus]OQM74639.1 FMN-binding domain-containing protein [Pseudaminobacter manganicus]